MTETFADQLGLQKIPYNVSVGSLNILTTTVKYITTATIKSNICAYTKTLTFLLVPVISNAIPDQSISRNVIQIPSNIVLADPEFYVSTPVQLLLGSGIALSILSIGQIKLENDNNHELYLQKTLLGWVIGGSITKVIPKNNKTFHITSALSFDLEKFWKIENCELHDSPKHINDEAVEFYERNMRRDANGRYILALPFNQNRHTLGLSRNIA